MLQKLGVLSFSEPYWLDNIATLPSHGMDHDMIGRVSDARRRPPVFPWKVRRRHRAHNRTHVSICTNDLPVVVTVLPFLV